MVFRAVSKFRDAHVTGKHSAKTRNLLEGLIIINAAKE